MNSEPLDATLAAIGSKTAYGGASMSGLGWLLSNEFFGLAGVCIGFIGLGINWHYKAKADRREQAVHEARMRQLEGEP